MIAVSGKGPISERSVEGVLVTWRAETRAGARSGAFGEIALPEQRCLARVAGFLGISKMQDRFCDDGFRCFRRRRVGVESPA